MRMGLALGIASACALAGCAGEVMSSQEFLFGFKDERQLECARGDSACVEVEDHLRAIHAETGNWCGTVLMMEYRQLVAMGERAVPTLRVALDVDDWIYARTAGRALRAVGRDPDVAVWCDAHPGAANFPWVCQELSPFVVWPELVGH